VLDRTPVWIRRVLLPAGVLALTAISLPRLVRPAAAAGSVPRFDHIFTIVMENHNYDEIIGNT